MNEPISPYVLTNKNSPAFWLIDNLWMPLAGSFSLTVISVLLSRFVALVSGAHRRTRILRNEGLYILEGQCTFNAGGQTVKAGPGTFVSIPRMVEHSFTVDVPNSRLLNFYTPAGVEMLLMSVAIAATERKPPVPNSLPMPPRWMVEECSREFGQIAVLGLPFVDPPTKDNMATKPSEVNPIKPYGVEVKNAPAYWSQGILWTNSRKLGSDWRFLLAYGAALLQEFRAPPHTHEQDEVLYIIEGQITLIAGAQRSLPGRDLLPTFPQVTFTVSVSTRRKRAL
jgi:quercetin dioxygenase-like cupin family protein